MALEDEEADDSASSVAMAHYEDEEVEDGTGKRSRTSEDLEGTANSSPSAPPPPEEPLNMVPLQVMPPVKTTKKPRLDTAWQIVTPVSSRVPLLCILW